MTPNQVTAARVGAASAAVALYTFFGRALAARRYRPWLFWACLPFFICMCVATVYGRYHCMADVLAGIVGGSISWAAGQWLTERKGALPRDYRPVKAGRRTCHIVADS